MREKTLYYYCLSEELFVNSIYILAREYLTCDGLHPCPVRRSPLFSLLDDQNPCSPIIPWDECIFLTSQAVSRVPALLWILVSFIYVPWHGPFLFLHCTYALKEADSLPWPVFIFEVLIPSLKIPFVLELLNPFSRRFKIPYLIKTPLTPRSWFPPHGPTAPRGLDSLLKAPSQLKSWFAPQRCLGLRSPFLSKRYLSRPKDDSLFEVPLFWRSWFSHRDASWGPGFLRTPCALSWSRSPHWNHAFSLSRSWFPHRGIIPPEPCFLPWGGCWPGSPCFLSLKYLRALPRTWQKLMIPYPLKVS